MEYGATTKSITVSPDTSKTYTVTVTEGSESAMDVVIVTVNSVTANAGEDITINEGKSVKLTASGGEAYVWSTGETTQSITVSPAKTAIYSVTVTKDGCEDTDNVEITVNQKTVSDPPPAKADAGEDATICLGTSITLTATGGNSYLWSTGDSKKNINVNPTRTTTYTLKATHEGITTTDTVTVTVENCKNSLVENDIQNNIEVFPNPTSGILNVNINSLSSDLDLLLINLNGSVIYRDKLISNQNIISKQIDVSRFAKGMYFIKLSNANQNEIKKIIFI